MKQTGVLISILALMFSLSLRSLAADDAIPNGDTLEKELSEDPTLSPAEQSSISEPALEIKPANTSPIQAPDTPPIAPAPETDPELKLPKQKSAEVPVVPPVEKTNLDEAVDLDEIPSNNLNEPAPQPKFVEISESDGSESALKAEDPKVEVEYSGPSQIEVQFAGSTSQSYRERRSTWTGIYGFKVEPFYPEKYRSTIDSSSYADAFASKKISLASISAGPKLNFALGSITGEVIAGSGQTSAEDGTGTSRSLKVTKTGVAIGIILDALFREPYVAPYFSGQMYTINFEENASAGKSKGSTSMATGFTIGTLIQLNWLEPELSKKSLIENGLNNSYLDLFASQYGSSGSTTEPKFETGFTLGGGVKLEF